MKLLIRNLPRSTSEDDLRKMFEAFGVVQSCSLVMDKKTGKSKGFAFIEMPRPGDAKAAVKTLNGNKLNGNIIRVKKAASKIPTIDKKPAAEIEPEKEAPEKTEQEKPEQKKETTVNQNIWPSND